MVQGWKFWGAERPAARASRVQPRPLEGGNAHSVIRASTHSTRPDEWMNGVHAPVSPSVLGDGTKRTDHVTTYLYQTALSR